METINDILKEMRKRCIDEKHSPELWGYFDRIEAAHEREMADALDTGAFVEATRKRESVTDCNGLNTNPAENVNSERVIYNGAKMREALIQIRDSVYIDPDDNKCHSDIDASDLREICDAALAEPPRNCDLYDLSRAKEEYKRYSTEICLRESNPFIAQDETLPFDEWLFAKAKGEHNGK